jgi:hypothetical protein
MREMQEAKESEKDTDGNLRHQRILSVATSLPISKRSGLRLSDDNPHLLRAFGV